MPQKKRGYAPAPRYAPLQGSWTYRDWLGLPDNGYKYEVINGVLFTMPPPGTGHQRVSLKLATKMYVYAEDNNLGEILEAPCGVRLPNQPVPVEPDIFFIKKERLHIIQKRYVEGAPDLVVEILSPFNMDYDRKTKFELYQAAGVPEYWLVNYQHKTIEIFTLDAGVYQLKGKYGIGEIVTSNQLVGFEMVVEKIFGNKGRQYHEII